MSELINRQAAIDAIKDRYYKYGRFAKIEELAGVIERLPTVHPEVLACGNGELIAQPEPQWIPVSERLPEKSANYLVTVRWYHEDDIDINVYEYNAWHKEWNDGESCGQRVIAWMPLPEAYKPNNK